VLLNEILVYTI